MFLTPLPLFIVASLRYNVGTDYPYTYTQHFLWRLNGYDLSAKFEAGFIKLIDLIQLFTDEPQWLFVVCAFIFSLFTAIAIYQQSNDYALSFLVVVISGIYFAYLNLMRNYVALAIVLYAFKYIEERKFKHFLFWVLLASSFHVTALLFLPVYFIYNIKINRWVVIGIIVTVFIGLPVIDIIARYIISYTKYAYYYNSTDSNVTPQRIYLLINILILCIQIYSYRFMKEDIKFQLHMKLEVLIVVLALGSYVVPMIRRLILVPMFTHILVIPYIENYKINKNLRKLIVISLCIICMISSYRQITTLGMHEVLPYQTIFSR